MKLSQTIKLSTTALVAAAMLSACGGPRARTTGTVIDTDSIQNAKIAAKDKSERLALAGEQLVPAAFFYADSVFDEALAVDPSNTRAIFYKTLLKPMMTLKGIANRIRPLAIKEGKLAKYEEELAKVPESGVRKFLLDGPQDIQDEVSAQKFLTEVRESYDAIRKYARANKGLQLAVNLPEIYIGGAVKDKMQKCEAEKIETGKFEIPCDISKVMKVQVGQAEMEALQQGAAAMQLFGIFYTSYSAEGLLALVKASEANPPKNAAENVALIKSVKGLGLLNSNNGLAAVPEMGLDLIAGARWVLANQKTLCPQGKESTKNRPGFIFSNGICPDTSKKMEDGKTSDEILAMAEQILRGPVQNHVVKTNGGTVVTTVDATAPFIRPVVDLKSQLPTTFNECGKATSVPDKTLGGVFPRGDGQAVLEMDGKINANCAQ